MTTKGIDEIQEKIVGMYNAGKKVREIEEELGVTKGALDRALKAYGIHPDRMPRLTGEQKRGIVGVIKEARVKGWGIQKQADRCGVSHNTLKAVAKEYGVEVFGLRKRGK